MPSDADTELAIPVDFDAFYARTGRQMLSLAYSFTGDWGDAEDLVQEAYAAAHRRWNVVGAYEDPTAWVRRVVTNGAVSRWRRVRRELDVRRRLEGRRPAPVSETDGMHDQFWAAVRALPQRQRAVTVLYYVEDQSVEAIAETLGCSTGTVKTQLFRARRTLADRLGASIEGE